MEPESTQKNEVAQVNSPMEVDEKSVICKNGIASSSVILLHPLVALNISDHVTRFILIHEELPYALGLLLGKQTGREIEIFNSFDICFDVLNGNWIVDRPFLENRLTQISQIFPHLDIIGWYSLGTAPTPLHLNMHAQITQINESPILLMFDHRNKEEVTIRTYETLIDLTNNLSREVFSEVPYTLKTTEAESIGVDHAAGAISSGVSDVSDILGSHQIALSMLTGRIKVIIDYMQGVKEGELQPREEILRAIGSLTSTLSLSKEDNQSFVTHKNEELTDALMAATLSILTKGFLTHDEVSCKCNILYSNNSSNKKMKSIDLVSTMSRMKPL